MSITKIKSRHEPWTSTQPWSSNIIIDREFGNTQGEVLVQILIFEPAHEIMVLITQATSEGPGEPAHPRSLARVFAVRTHEVWK